MIFDKKEAIELIRHYEDDYYNNADVFIGIYENELTTASTSDGVPYGFMVICHFCPTDDCDRIRRMSDDEIIEEYL